MESVVFAAATDQDLGQAVEVYLQAKEDMHRRHGRSVASEPVEVALRYYRHVYETGIFEVAKVDGQVAGVCLAIVRDDIWFLSGFWARPQLQHHKVGGTLLDRVWQQGVEHGARVFSVWSSVEPTAMAAYMRRGMLPGTQLLSFGGTTAELSLPPVSARYEEREMDPAVASAIDLVVRATTRPVDHQFWQAEPGRQGRLILHAGKPCGYYYTTDAGEVLPAAWANPADGEAVLSLACRAGLARSGSTALRLPGVNHAGIRFALTAGMKLQTFSHFLTTAPYGHLDQYAASGPLLF